MPIHEPYYIYRIRPDSIVTSARVPGKFLKDRAQILESNFAFFAKISRESGYDEHISPLSAAKWLDYLYFNWFSPRAIRRVPRNCRHETISAIFKGGFGNFDLLTCASTLPRMVSALFLKLFVRHPSFGWVADAFFLHAYYPLVGLRDSASVQG